MKVLSWFAGIGGFDLAFRRAGHEIVGACEINTTARKVYAARFGEPAWFPHDIKEVTPDATPEADIWCGGFPCQDLSVAGRRAGIHGARSGIVWHLLDLAGRSYPRWILLENVPGLLADDAGRGFGSLLARLDELGYVGAWATLDARWFGVPQRRRRVFILACRAGVGDPGAVLAVGEGGVRHLAPGRAPGSDVAGTLGGGASESGGWRCRADEAAGGRLVVGAIGGPGGADDNDAQGNRLVVVVEGRSSAREIAAALTSHGGAVGRSDFDTENFVVTPFVKVHRGGVAGTDQDYDRWEPEDTAPTLAKGDLSDKRATTVVAFNVHAAESGAQKRHAYETELARPLDSAGGFAAGQGGTIVAGFNMKAESGSKGGNGYTPNGSPPVRGNNPPATIGAGVRRLTPTECERLQGFGDGWTCLCGADPYTTAACRCPDGPRYRALGNAVAVPVVEWIAKRFTVAAGADGGMP